MYGEFDVEVEMGMECSLDEVESCGSGLSGWDWDGVLEVGTWGWMGWVW